MKFPRNILEFQSRFATEQACWEYLAKVRWPEGFICPRCGAPLGAFVQRRGLWQCANRHQISVTAETVMHSSHMPLQKWFWAAYLVSTQTTGISAMVLHRQVGVKYESAYMMLQRLRAGMVNPDRTKLRGVVEVDEGYLTGGYKRATKGKAGRGTAKPLVIAAVEVIGKKTARVRLRRIKSVSEKEVKSFLTDHVAIDSTIVSDGLAPYRHVRRWGYGHLVREGASNVEVAKQLPHVHRIFSNLKGWIVGTHRGVSTKHLQAYLNEFMFRYNRKANPQRAFLAVLGISTHREGPTYTGIYEAGEPEGWVHPNPIKPQHAV